MLIALFEVEFKKHSLSLTVLLPYSNLSHNQINENFLFELHERSPFQNQHIAILIVMEDACK